MIKARVVFVCSTAETASLHIGKAILSKDKFTEVHGDFPFDVFQYKDCLLIFEDQELAGDPDLQWENHFDCDCFVILYRHSGRGGKSRLTVHPQGNFSAEPKVGDGRSIAFVHPLYMRHMLGCLKKVVEDCKSNFLVNYEVTHHGPTRLMTPVFFVEIGDGGEQWEDPVANVMVSRAVHMFVDKKVEDAPSALGFGGEHYAERFERRVWSEGWAFGHMIPERDFEHLTPELLDMCIEKTMPKVDFVVVDKRKKGTEEQRKVFFKVFEDKGIEIKKL